MKWIKRIIFLGIVLILAAAGVVYVSINSLLRSAIERQATASLGVPTTLGSAHLAILAGTVGLSDLKVSSPPNFSSPDIFTLGDASVTVRYGQLTDMPIHVHQIVIDQPGLVVEQSNIQLNLESLLHQMPQTPKTSSGTETQPVKLVIDELDLNNAQVTFMPGIPGLTDTIPVSIPSISLKNVGNSNGDQSGATIKDVVMQAATAMAMKALDTSKLPEPVKVILSQELSGLSGQLGSGFTGQIQDLAGSLSKQVAPKLQNTVDQLLNGVKKSPGK